MVYITSPVLIYLYNWKFVPLTTYIQFLLPYPLPLVTTNLISFSMKFFFFNYNNILVSLTQHSDLILLYISK